MLRFPIIAFLLLIPLAFPAAAYAQRASQEVTFDGAEGFKLRGEILWPDKKPGTKRPALLLLPGSGPTDRDANQPPMLKTDLLRDIARRLSDEGFVTLRFDKRAAHVYRNVWPKDPAEHSDFFSYENFVADATAAYRHLRAAEGVDPARVAVLGHSEGGLFALQIGHDLADSDAAPAGLILAGTAGRKLDAVMIEQIAALLKKQTSDESIRQSYMNDLNRGLDALRRGEPLPADLPAGLKPLLNASVERLLRSYITIDPADLAAKVKGPVLVVQGERDVQISAERDAPRLQQALDKRTTGDAELLIIPGASHNFKTVTDDNDPGFAGPVAPQALDAIVQWCQTRLGARD